MALRKILENDKEWLNVIKERRKRLTKKVLMTESEKRKYVLSTGKDYEILAKIKKLEKSKITKEDEFLLKFARTQLEHDWRKPMLQLLNKMLKKYQ